jgi:hypothetical protein
MKKIDLTEQSVCKIFIKNDSNPLLDTFEYNGAVKLILIDCKPLKYFEIEIFLYGQITQLKLNVILI